MGQIRLDLCHPSRVDSDQRFVEEQYVRAVNHRAGHAELLPHAFAQGRDQFISLLGEVVLLQQGVALRLVNIQRAVTHGYKSQVLVHRQQFVERRDLGHEGEAALREGLVGLQVVAVDANLPAGWSQNPRDAAHRRGLSGSVGSDDAHDLARRDGERQVIHRTHGFIFFDQMGDFEHGLLTCTRTTRVPFQVAYSLMATVFDTAQQLREQVGKAVVGQSALVDQVLVAILANGHILLEGVPGVAKTLLVRSIAQALNLQFTRIQFTPDLMPSDVIGTNVFDPKTTDFKLRKGPIFTNILLADEINRTPPKTQSALLEAMEERQSTIDGERHMLPDPFLVFATQNPIEYEGTYPLPEAQQDRFLMKVLVPYPPKDAELEVLRRFHAGFRSQQLEKAGITPVVDAAGLAALRAQADAVTIEPKIFDYVYALVSSTRDYHEIQIGASPRAGLALIACGKAAAALRGRDFLIPDDIKEFTLPVLRHRVMLRADVDTQGITVDEVLQDLVNAQAIPR